MSIKANVYKPRYKVAYQAKSKIWPYKNSRLRRFFNIRGRRIVRGGAFRKYVLVFNRMKWTIARRFIKPYRRPRRAIKRRYRNAFYTKQQLRHFYGKIKENAFRKIFRNHLISTTNRNKAFFSALERRVDMFFFRMRLLPTIYACHQFVHHQGLVINRWRIEKSPNALVKIGDIVSLPKKYWRPMSKYLKYRIFFRLYGKLRFKKRQYTLLKKKVWWVSRYKRMRGLFWEWKVEHFRFARMFYFLKEKLFIFFKNVSKIFRNLLCSEKGMTKAKTFLRLAVLKELYARLYSIYHFFFTFTAALGQKMRAFWFFIKRKRKEAARLKKEKRNWLKRLKLPMNIKTKRWPKAKTVKKRVKRFRLVNKFKRKKLRQAASILRQVVNFRLEGTRKHLLFRGFLPSSYLKMLNLLWVLKLEELTFYQSLVSNFPSQVNAQLPVNNEVLLKEKMIIEAKARLKPSDLLSLIKKRKSLLRKRYILLEQKALQYFSLSWRRRMKKYRYRTFSRYDTIRARRVPRGNALIFFLVNKKFKKQRRLSVPRLKGIHWYIPTYIFFDARSLRGMLLCSPQPDEIVYTFRCSLFKIYSFYKALGL